MREGTTELGSVQEGAAQGPSDVGIDTTAPDTVGNEGSDVQGDDSGAEGEQDSGPESPRQTVERIFRQAQKENDGDKSAESKAEEPTLVRKAKKTPEQLSLEKPKEEGFKIPAPSRLTASEKEAFNSMPAPLKKAVHQMFKEHESLLTKQNKALYAEIRENQAMREAVRPYLLAHPELQQEGWTESKFVGALVAAHQRLTDPKSAKQAWLELGSQVGVDAETLKALQEQSGGQQIDISSHPDFVALRSELNRLKSKSDGAEEQRFQSLVQGIVSEVETVRNEQDASGRYLYPKLHEAAYLQQVKPLVSALVATIPGLTYGEAYRRAYQMTEGGQTGNSTQVNQARFPQQNQSEQLQRAQAAAVSVRGRSAPSAAGNSTEIPPEALKTPRDSVVWALQQLRRGA